LTSVYCTGEVQAQELGILPAQVAEHRTVCMQSQPLCSHTVAVGADTSLGQVYSAQELKWLEPEKSGWAMGDL